MADRMAAKGESPTDDRSLAISALRLMKGTGREGWLDVEGTSMRPLLGRGDRILYRMEPADGIRPGDLIVFIKDDCLICHRFIRWQGQAESRTALQAGDDISEPSAVPVDNLLGVAVELRVRGRRIMLDKPFASAAQRLLGRALAQWGGVRPGPVGRRLRRALVFFADRAILLTGRRMRD